MTGLAAPPGDCDGCFDTEIVGAFSKSGPPADDGSWIDGAEGLDPSLREYRLAFIDWEVEGEYVHFVLLATHAEQALLSPEHFNCSRD